VIDHSQPAGPAHAEWYGVCRERVLLRLDGLSCRFPICISLRLSRADMFGLPLEPRSRCVRFPTRGSRRSRPLPTGAGCWESTRVVVNGNVGPTFPEVPILRVLARRAPRSFTTELESVHSSLSVRRPYSDKVTPATAHNNTLFTGHRLAQGFGRQ